MKDKFNRISKCLFWVLHCLHTHSVLGLMGHVNFPEYLCFQIIYSLPWRNLAKNITLLCFFLLQNPGGNLMPCLVCVLSQHRNPQFLGYFCCEWLITPGGHQGPKDNFTEVQLGDVNGFIGLYRMWMMSYLRE